MLKGLKSYPLTEDRAFTYADNLLNFCSKETLELKRIQKLGTTVIGEYIYGAVNEVIGEVTGEKPSKYELSQFFSDFLPQYKTLLEYQKALKKLDSIFLAIVFNYFEVGISFLNQC